MEQVINIKRAYEPASPEDGFRIYIDRLWPRGLSHTTFHYDNWDKEIAPSNQLREWFHEDPEGRWKEFEERYIKELQSNPALVSLKDEIKDKSVITLLYSSHDPVHNNAIILQKLLLNSLLNT